MAGIVINCRDVTDRWRAEEEVRSSEKQYRLLFQGNPNPMWVFDLETLAFLEVNEAATQHYGYSREEFLAMTVVGHPAAGEECALPGCRVENRRPQLHRAASPQGWEPY